MSVATQVKWVQYFFVRRRLQRGFVYAQPTIRKRRCRETYHGSRVHATVLNQLGLDHHRLTFAFGGRDVSLTDVHGQVNRDLLA